MIEPTVTKIATHDATSRNGGLELIFDPKHSQSRGSTYPSARLFL